MTSLGRRPAGNPFEIRRSWIEEEKESRGEKRTSKLSVPKKTILVLVLKMAMDVCPESKEQRERERGFKGWFLGWKVEELF